MSAMASKRAPRCAAPGSSWELRPGDVFAPGRRVIRRLAGGGAHEAFLVDAGGSRSRAVAKLPRPHLADDPHCLLRLRDEARALERLTHVSLPRHFDTVLSGPYPHLLLEYVPGPTLHAALGRHDSLNLPAVARLGRTLARALEHVAGAGWVHLDVKPSNIVLNASPRLLDFELARPAAEAARMTRPAGTLAYMPPEQRAAGGPNAPRIGPPADVFALAVSLSEALTGRPLTGPSPRRSAALLGPVGALLDEALAPAPGDRPTAGELAAGLAELAGAPAPVAAAA